MQAKTILGRAELRAAIDNLEPPIKYTKADTVHILCMKTIESMHVREVAASSKRESFQEAGEKQALGGVDVDFRHDLKRRKTDEGDDSDQVDPSCILSTEPSQAVPLLSRLSTLQTPGKQQEDDVPFLNLGLCARRSLLPFSASLFPPLIFPTL